MGRGVRAGSYCQLSINSRKRSCLAFFWWGVAYWGKWGACLFLAGGSSHQQDHILGLSTGTSVVPASFPPAGQCLCPRSMLRCPPSPRTIPTQNHSLCNFYFNQEVIKSMYSLKTV